VTFHDGSPCGVADVVASFEAKLDAATASAARNNIGPITKVAAGEGRQVVFTLRARERRPAVMLATPTPRSCPARSPGCRSGTAGPEAVDRHRSSWSPRAGAAGGGGAEPAILRAGPPYLDRVEVVVYPDDPAEAQR
jgi:peptide/nickel transport system substrate-binding protein